MAVWNDGIVESWNNEDRGYSEPPIVPLLTGSRVMPRLCYESQWQSNLERGAVARLTMHFDAAVVRFDDLLDHVEPHAGAFGETRSGSASSEGLEEHRQVFFGNTRSLVRDGQHRLRILSLDTHSYARLRRTVFDRMGDQVGKHALDPIRIRVDRAALVRLHGDLMRGEGLARFETRRTNALRSTVVFRTEKRPFTTCTSSVRSRMMLRRRATSSLMPYRHELQSVLLPVGDIAGHVVERPRQGAEFILMQDWGPDGEVAPRSCSFGTLT